MCEKYEELSKPLKYQLNIIHENFFENEDVIEKYLEYIKKYNIRNKRIRAKYFKLAILETIQFIQMMDSTWFDYVFCYSDHGKNHGNVYLKKLLKQGTHACVLRGQLKRYISDKEQVENDVVIKWYKSKNKNITYESNIYERLDSMDCPVPWYSTCYKIWNEPVLILEKLERLSHVDNPYKMGIHVIDQLRYLHTFGVHCDIKPENIMKRLTTDLDTGHRTGDRTGNCEYLLIDFGGVATQKLDYGYRRWVWSEKWTSQASHTKDQLVTYKADFIELAYTIQAMLNWSSKKKTRRHGTYKVMRTRKMKMYMDYVENKIDDTKPSKDKYYDTLIRILSIEEE